MSRDFIAVAAFSALAGCYNPPYPPDSAGVGPLPQDRGSVAQDRPQTRRRDSAAASGSSVGAPD